MLLLLPRWPRSQRLHLKLYRLLWQKLVSLARFIMVAPTKSLTRFDISVVRLLHHAERQLFFSYTHGRARGDLNDFGNYLGTFPIPIIRENQFGNLPADLPNRFLAWGLVPLPWKFRIAPVVEYRSGFPYIETNAAQEYSGVPNQRRFPNLVSVDARVSKDFQVRPKYAVRLSVSGFNLTNHFHPEEVHGNTADPAHGLFFGHRGRRFTADFDVLF